MSPCDTCSPVAQIKEIVVRNPHDPRREESMPPPGDAPSDKQIVLLPPIQTELIVDTNDTPPDETKPTPAAAEAPRPQSFAPSDPRLVEIERAASMGDWSAALRLADSLDDAAKLPPGLALVWALARKETLKPDDKNASAVTHLAVRAVASLLGVNEKSDLALLIAKRLLRQNPASWRQAPAPSTGISIFIMIVALIVGSAIGLLLSGVPLRLDFLH